jgi:uncharacterized protein (TIGR03067 family)
MNKVIVGAALACLALASDDPRDYDGRTAPATLEGTWVVKAVEVDGKPSPPAEFKGSKLIVKGERVTLIDRGAPEEMTCRTDSGRRPAHLDLTMLEGPRKGKTLQLIYSLEGDTLKLGVTPGSDTRPVEFRTGKGSLMRVITLQRESR